MVGVVDPATHAYPAGHGPLQFAVALPLTLPYRPALHAEHTLAPVTLYCPGLHNIAVAFVDPAGHAYPAAHGPLQLLLVDPVTSPYRPASHAPLQPAVALPLTLPYSPALQFMHTLAPATLYCPGRHNIAVAFVDPAGHAYPAAHGPLQLLLVAPVTFPYRPASHAPLQPGPAPTPLPYRPAGHATQLVEAAVLY